MIMMSQISYCVCVMNTLSKLVFYFSILRLYSIIIHPFDFASLNSILCPVYL